MLLFATVFAFPPTPSPPIVRSSREPPEELPCQQAHKILRLTVFWRTRQLRTRALPFAIAVPPKRLGELGITLAAADRALDQIDPTSLIGESGSTGACGPEQGRGGLRALGTVRAAACPDGRLGRLTGQGQRRIRSPDDDMGYLLMAAEPF